MYKSCSQMFYLKNLLDKNRIIIAMFRYFPIQEEGPLEGYPVQGRLTLDSMFNVFYRPLTNITDLFSPQQREVRLLNVPWDSYVK